MSARWTLPPCKPARFAVFFLREVNFKNQRSFFRYFAFEEDVFVAESQFLLLTESQFFGVTRFGFLF